jgi:hypothetical protein
MNRRVALCVPSTPVLTDRDTYPAANPDVTEAYSRFRIRTRLYAAAANVNTQPTLCSPRCLTFRSIPTVFSQPKTSSIRFRLR